MSIKIERLNVPKNVDCSEQQQIYGGTNKALEEQVIGDYANADLYVKDPNETLSLPSTVFFEGTSEKSRYAYNLDTGKATKVW